VASFFFAGCPGTCRQLNFSLAGIAEHVPADVRLVSITCDPENDTPETLARYAELFSADPQRWKFLTGPMKDLERISRDNFQVGLEKQKHTERAFVVDRQGHLRGRFSVLDPDQADKLTSLVKRLEAEP
jgi:cytochrome oxidase Cu insertion factor (SCO1/SenC/PrrC family)